MATDDKDPAEATNADADAELAAHREGKKLPAGETPDQVVERVVDEQVDNAAAASGIAGSYQADITFHSPSRLEDPAGPTATALDEALTEFLGQKYGFRVGVRVRRMDR